MTNGVTLVELAAQLGLSKTTVADALAGSGRVATSTQERVRRAADRAGYAPNRAARTLRRGTTATLGLYFPPAGRSLAFYMDFTFGAAEAAAEGDQDLTILTQVHRSNRRPALDGVVAVDARPGDPMIEQLVASRAPMVAAGRLPGEQQGRAAVIEIDHRRMATQMFDHLHAQGAHQVVFVAPDESFDSAWSGDIRLAYRAWCRRSGLQSCLRRVAVAPRLATLQRLIDDTVVPRLRPEAPIGVVFAAQSLAGRALPILLSQGLRVPTDCVIGGLVGDPVERHSPLISTLDLRARQFGRQAVRLLLSMAAGTAHPGDRVEHGAVLIGSAPGAGVAAVVDPHGG